MSDKAKWAVIYLAVSLVSLLPHFVASHNPDFAGGQWVQGILLFAPYLGLSLTAILGWQINQTRIFWASLFLLGFYSYFLHIEDFHLTIRTVRTLVEITGSAFPLALCILFLIHETRLWSDRTLARLLLALSPFLLFFTLSKWAPDVYANIAYWAPDPPSGFLRIPNLAWVSTGIYLLYLYLQPDLKIRPFLISLAAIFPPFLFGIQSCLGVLSIAARKNDTEAYYSALQLKDFDIIVGFTAMTAILLHSILHMYWRKVYLDILTGVPNRQALDERLHTLTKDYALAMVDIDHFKKFNDTYGHAEGDNVLRMVAQHLEEHLGDRVYRYGGEEFCAVFEGDGLAEAESMMEKTRSSLEKRKFRLRQNQRKKEDLGSLFSKKTTGGKIVHITVSIGVSASGKDPTAYEQVIKRADKLLYEAKEKGRNRVVAGK